MASAPKENAAAAVRVWAGILFGEQKERRRTVEVPRRIGAFLEEFALVPPGNLQPSGSRQVSSFRLRRRSDPLPSAAGVVVPRRGSASRNPPCKYVPPGCRPGRFATAMALPAWGLRVALRTGPFPRWVVIARSHIYLAEIVTLV